jgi:hypothetical protein
VAGYWIEKTEYIIKVNVNYSPLCWILRMKQLRASVRLILSIDGGEKAADIDKSKECEAKPCWCCRESILSVPENARYRSCKDLFQPKSNCKVT